MVVHRIDDPSVLASSWHFFSYVRPDTTENRKIKQRYVV